MTFNGGAMPLTSNEGGVDFYLVDRSTGALQYIGGPSYDEQNIGQYTLVAGSDHFTTKVVAGTYDVLMSRNADSNGAPIYVQQTLTGDTLPNGYSLLQTGVTVNPGTQSLAIDIASTDLSVSMTYNGAALPTTSNEGSFSLFLVDRATGAEQYIGGPNYDEQNIGQYTLVPGSDRFTTKVPAGTYDVLYSRNADNNGAPIYVQQTLSGDTLPNGYVLLQQQVTITPGTQSLAIDVPGTDVSVSMTYNGAALPTTSNEGSFSLFLIDRSTNAEQYLGGPSYDEQNIGQYTLVAGSDHFTTKVPAGTYDVLYSRNADSNGAPIYVQQTLTGDTLPNGYSLLQQNVVISGATQSLAINVPGSDLSVSMTYNNASLPTTSNEGSFSLFLVDRSTGAQQYIGGPSYDEQNIGQYTLVAGSDHFTTKVPVGTYDVLYSRNADSNGAPIYVQQTLTGDTLPNGYILLQSHVAVTQGSQSLVVNVPGTNVSVSVTLNGSALPTTSNEGGISFFLVNEVTGAEQYIGGPNYDEQNIGQYTLVPGSDQFSTQVVAGTYDVLYSRNADSNGAPTYVQQTLTGDTLPNGYSLLQTGVTISGQTVSLPIDIPATVLAGLMTYNSGPLPTTSNEGAMSFFLIDRSTSAEQYIASPNYDEQTIGQYTFVPGTDQYQTLVLRGVYDVLYQRNADSNGTPIYVQQTLSGDTLPNGDSLLDSCVYVP